MFLRPEFNLLASDGQMRLKASEGLVVVGAWTMAGGRVEGVTEVVWGL